MHPVWQAFVARIVALALLTLGVWLLFDIVVALGFAVLATVVLMADRTRAIASLSRWIEGRDDRDFPKAGGAWGAVFLALARRLRWDAQAMALVEAEAAAFRQAMAALPDGVVLLNGLSQISWCNPAAERHLGIRLNEDAGRSITHIVRIPGFAEYLQLNDPAEPFTFSGGGERERVLGLEMVPVGNGGHLLVTFDISDVHHAEAMRRDFVANVSHELRTPLTVIHGFLEHLADPAMPAAERAHFVALMEEQTGRMLRLVDDLLKLSRLESERLPRRDEAIAMPALIERLVEEAKSLSRGEHRFEVEIDAVDARGDPDELYSAFGNLLSNAVRYTPAGGTITVRWQDALGGPSFAVTDTGIGIAPEAIPRLTERFFRVDKGRSRDTGGTGLGLAIAKHVLLRHQADLRIVSSPGEGSTFTVRLPPERRIARRPSA
jgi:two-component system phosphate regulon sensor histidine kinase PhoR